MQNDKFIKKPFSIKLTDRMYKELKELSKKIAEERGEYVSISEVIRMSIKFILESHAE